MTAVDRLVANGNSIISFLKTFSSPTADDVTFTWINDDDSTEDISFANIKKFQDILTDKFDGLQGGYEDAFATLKDDLRTRNERADYCRRVENTLTISDSITFSSDKYLKWSNRLISIGSGSDNGVYGSQGHISIRVPSTDTVITGHGNADDVTVTDDGIKMEQWGALYYEFEDSQDNKSIDENWHYVGYNDPTGIIPTNWILVASFNDDTDSVTIAGQTVQMGRVIYAQSVSDPILGTNLQNIGGVIKDRDNNILIGKPIPIQRLGDVLTDGFLNDWVEYDGNWQCNISKDGFGVVTMNGLIRDGESGKDIGTLPVEYRPIQPRTLSIQQCNDEEYERLNVYNSGTINCGTDGTRSGTSWMSINLSWQARVEV